MSPRGGSIVVVGTGAAAMQLVQAARASGLAVADAPVTPHEFINQQASATQVLVAVRELNREAVVDLAWQCIGIHVPLWLDVTEMPALTNLLAVQRLGEHLCIVLRPPRATSVVRRTIDLLVAGVALLVLVPLLMTIAVAVKLSSPGPALHRAEVVGEDGRHFTWYKFRTMRVAQDDETWRRERFAEFVRGGRDIATKIIDDARITRVGRILRRHSLDELPQLFSVLTGDMTLIGPRPCLVYEYELLRPWHRRRFAVRPGLTGLWQVSGRGQVHADEMAFLDICYALARTWRSDLRVLWETVKVVFTGRGAA